MRFSVLVVFVATFVASCGSFVSAETNALEDHSYDNTDVVRRLRGDNEIDEERGFPFFKGADDHVVNPELTKLETHDDFLNGFSKNDRKKLEGKNGEKINMKAVLDDHDPVMLYKLTEEAIKGSKGKEGWFKKTVKYGLMAAGLVGLLYVLYCWAVKKPKQTTPAPSANGETTGGA